MVSESNVPFLITLESSKKIVISSCLTSTILSSSTIKLKTPRIILFLEGFHGDSARFVFGS